MPHRAQQWPRPSARPVGKVQAQVEDRKPATAAPDKLTLSKGSLKGQKAAEDQLAKDKQASEANARMAELSKNISDLNKGRRQPAAGAAPATAPAASTPAAIKAEVPGVPATPTAPASTCFDTRGASRSGQHPCGCCVRSRCHCVCTCRRGICTRSARTQGGRASSTDPSKSPSFLDGLMEVPMIPLAGGGLLALC